MFFSFHKEDLNLMCRASGFKFGVVESAALCTTLLKQLEKAVEGTQDITAMTYGKRIARVVSLFFFVLVHHHTLNTCSYRYRYKRNGQLLKNTSTSWKAQPQASLLKVMLYIRELRLIC
jgi:hypothetical protein